MSACYSAKAGGAFVAAGVPHVVAVRLDSTVQDKWAMKFSKEFYAHLLAGYTVRNAFDKANLMVRLNRNNGSAGGAPAGGSGAAGGESGGGVGTSEFLLLPEGPYDKEDPHDKAIFDCRAFAEQDDGDG